MWNFGLKASSNVLLRLLVFWEILDHHLFCLSKNMYNLVYTFYLILIFLICAKNIFLRVNAVLYTFREDMRNSFNFLLIALICMDSCYLIGAMLESFRKCFALASDIHIHLFPYFLYPGLNIASKLCL